MLLTLIGALCLLGAAYFLAPLCIGVIHIGMFWPAAVLMVCAAGCFFPRAVKRLPRLVRVAGAALLCACLCVSCVLGLWLSTAAADRAETCAAPPQTVVLLGCRVYDGKPSLMLQGRIDAAYAYLVSHPDAVVITTGGLDGGEYITEGGCAARELIGRGIAPHRVYAEEKSFDTRENLLFAAEIIRREGLDPHVAIASDNFHQLRGQLYAAEAGLEPRSVGCASPVFLGLGYACREMVAVLAILAGWE